MSQVADINGKKVYSDKRVNSIINTRVTFTDGSWCDVATGEVVNRGEGYINIGSPQESERITIGPDVFKARNLMVRNIAADLDVQVHESDLVEVTIIGPASEAKTIRTTQRGDSLLIEGESSELGGGNVTIVSRGGSSVTRVSQVSGGSVVIGGSISVGGRGVVITGGNENQTKVTVKVPMGTAVRLSDISGLSTVGDTRGDLNVNATAGDVQAGSVANADVNIRGSSDVSIRDVFGSLSMKVMGSGDIEVATGVVTSLSANVMGSGDIDFGGQAENAVLTVMGSGDIKVAHVNNTPVKSVMGSGKIRVGNW